MTAIDVRNVTKRFGTTTAVDDVSFDVAAGEVVGLIGANGAGKTTTMRMLLGLLRPTSGSVSLLGHSPSRATRSRIGYVSQGLGLYPDLTIDENIEFIAEAYGSKPPDLGPDLQSMRGSLVGELSLGHRRQVAFAAALSHSPEVLVLDEPTSGVGPLGRAELWSLIGTAANTGTAVLVSTHYMEEAEQCDRLIMMSAGRRVADGSAEEITASVSTVAVTTDDWRAALEALQNAGARPAMIGASLRVPGSDESDVRRALEVAGIACDVATVPARFDDAFVALSGG